MILATQTTLLGRYDVIKTLGEGGYGAVFEARDRTSGDRVALKRLLNTSATTLSRFKQEFRAVQEVHHPNLVRLDALFEEQGKWTIAMELVEGTDLLHYVYDGESPLCFDEDRLRDSFAQLAEGLSALHAAGFIHRDLKPSNVRVTPEGRVVLLDFGLTTALDPALSIRTTGLGTIAYMAPEQGTTSKIGPEADWYAFGVCLYEALTGVLPIEGDTPFALLLAKQKPVLHTPLQLVPGVPADLNDLCLSLLEVSPAARAGSRKVRSALVRGKPDEISAASGAPAKVGAFEGRELELAALGEAYAQVRRGGCRVVLVEGESGIGKSALVEHFLALPEAPQGEALVLRSRCYENELLAFKAFDGAVETLARMLAKLDPEQCASLLPPRAALLCRLFPALSSVKALVRAPLLGVAADPSVQRIEAFGLFARLLAALSAQRPVVLAIDDLQWADVESFRLLQSLLAGPGGPRCLILATVRPRSELEREAAENVDALRKLGAVSDLPLHGLPHANALALAREQMGSGVPESRLEMIVKESMGHPLFLTVLTRFAETQDDAAAELTLDAAIHARIGRLSADARALLEAVAMIGSPQPAPLCGRAAGLQEADVAGLIAELCNQKLLRRRRAGEIACFHDQIRRIAVAGLPSEREKALHAQIAAALASRVNSDPTELARHYEAAEQTELAFEAYRRAAEKATATLAFDRVATLYARALDVSQTLSLPPERRTELMVARGHALARAGRSGEAAHQYLDAAVQGAGEERIRTRIWAVRHLLQSAHVEEGMAAARALLAEIGVPLPASTPATVARLVWDRAYLGIRGLAVTPATEPIPAHARMQLDALWEMTIPVSWIDPLASAVLSTRHLRLARAHGEPTHMARALADEAFTRTIQTPDDTRADELIARARELAKASSDPAVELTILFREGTLSNLRWDLRRSQAVLEHAQQFGTENCPDQPWLLTNIRCVLSAAWANMGEHAKLAACNTTWIAEARDRNDQFGLSVLEGLGFGTFRHLMADDPDLARDSLDGVLSPWPVEPFSFARFGELVGVTNSELYRGGVQGHEWITRELPRLARAFVLKTGLGKATLLMYRAHLALAARNAASGARADQLIAEVRACVKELRHVNSALAKLNVGSLEAQLAALAGDRPRALELARQVHAETVEHGGLWLAHTLDYFEGLLEGGEAGHAQQSSALAYFAGQGWKKPRRALAILCPVLDALE